MTHSSQDPIAESAPQQTARIIPFDGQNETQRAVQRRAQEFIDSQAIQPKVSPLRRIVTFAIALIPVGLTVAGFLVSVQAVRVITSIYAKPPATPATAEEASAPQPDYTQSEPGIVILVPEKPAAAVPAPSEPAPNN